MKVLVSHRSPPEAAPREPAARIFVETTEAYAVDWRVLFAFHQHASQDQFRSRWRRQWHADQARIIRIKHPLDAAVGYCWSEQCRLAREAFQ